MDFYITSRLGELIGNGFEGNIAIVSGDQRLKSVQEYWTTVSCSKNKIVLSPAIADEIASAGESNEIHRIPMQKFRDTALIDKIDEIEKVFKKNSSRKIVYLDFLKKFGKAEGLFVYNCIKDLVG